MSLHNLLVYSIQIAILLSTGGVLFHLLQPRLRLYCWQALLAACLALPLLEPWQAAASGDSAGVSIRYSTGFPSAFPTPSYASWFGRTIVLILFAGVAFRLIIFGLGLLRLSMYRKRSRLHSHWQSRVEIRVSGEIAGPATFGIFRPVVLLPERWIGNQSVLHHELVHVQRRDWLFIAAEELARAIFWFHPLVWYAIAQIQLAREEVVDREVVSVLQSREQYVETLLAIAAARSGLDLAPAPLFLRKRHLRKRIASLMKEVSMSRLRLNSSLAALLTLTLAAGWFAVRLFPLQAAQEEKEKAKQEQKDDETVINVGGNAQALKLIKKVTPKYPRSAKEAHIQGVVKLTAFIAKDGTVKDVELIEGEPELADAAIPAVRQWVYETTLLNGKPVAVKTHVDVNFTLTQ